MKAMMKILLCSVLMFASVKADVADYTITDICETYLSENNVLIWRITFENSCKIDKILFSNDVSENRYLTDKEQIDKGIREGKISLLTTAYKLQAKDGDIYVIVFKNSSNGENVLFQKSSFEFANEVDVKDITIFLLKTPDISDKHKTMVKNFVAAHSEMFDDNVVKA